MSFGTSGIYPNGSYDFREGLKTVKERFSIGNKVSVWDSDRQYFGTIVELSDEFPYRAGVLLDHGNGSSEICWIKTENLTLRSFK